MTDDRKSVVLEAFGWMLQPVARMLLRAGVTWKEAAEISKAVFVKVATREFGLHGRPTNISRVAIMTGLGRREVSRMRRLLEDGQAPPLDRMNSATRMLTGWHTDADYIDASGAPRRLRFDAGEPGFASLARRYAADIAPITMLRELVRVGAVSEQPDGLLQVRKRYYMPLAMDSDAIVRAGSVLHDLGTTIEYNLARDADHGTRFEGRATAANIRSADEQAFRDFIEAEGQALLERVDEWLVQHEATPEAGRTPKTMRLGIGVYQVHDDEK